MLNRFFNFIFFFFGNLEIEYKIHNSAIWVRVNIKYRVFIWYCWSVDVDANEKVSGSYRGGPCKSYCL